MPEFRSQCKQACRAATPGHAARFKALHACLWYDSAEQQLPRCVYVVHGPLQAHAMSSCAAVCLCHTFMAHACAEICFYLYVHRLVPYLQARASCAA